MINEREKKNKQMNLKDWGIRYVSSDRISLN